MSQRHSKISIAAITLALATAAIGILAPTASASTHARCVNAATSKVVVKVGAKAVCKTASGAAAAGRSVAAGKQKITVFKGKKTKFSKTYKLAKNAHYTIVVTKTFKVVLKKERTSGAKAGFVGLRFVNLVPNTSASLFNVGQYYSTKVLGPLAYTKSADTSLAVTSSMTLMASGGATHFTKTINPHSGDSFALYFLHNKLLVIKEA